MTNLGLEVFIQNKNDFYFENLPYEIDYMRFDNIDDFIDWIWHNMPRLKVIFCGEYFNNKTDFSIWGDRFKEVLRMFDEVSNHRNKKNYSIHSGDWFIKWKTN